MYGIKNSPDTIKNTEISDLRTRVDQIDDDILNLLARRRTVSREIAEEKHRSEKPFHDGEREREVILHRLESASEYDLSQDLVSTLWEQIMADSLRVQFEYAQQRVGGQKRSVTVAIQGIEGSNSHHASLAITAGVDERSWLSCDRFADAVAAVKDGHADLAVLPIENTTSGAIGEVYDLMLDTSLSIVGETKVQVNHSLLGVRGASLTDLKTVHAHPQAVAQCADFLATLPDIDVVYATDTAHSARRIAEINNVTVAAIAGEHAAKLYGLDVLRSGISNRQVNSTRFVALAAEPTIVDSRVPSKTSVVLTVSNEAGALAAVLNVFAEADIALVKLESRPRPGDPWQEMFYLDFEGNLSDARITEAVAKIRRVTSFTRVLGTYPSLDLRPHRDQRSASTVRVATPPRSESTARTGRVDHKLVGRSGGKESIVDVGRVAFGGPELVVIAGPCAVESHDQVMTTARAVKESGGEILRGGCFKPRTSPYSFQGLGWEGVEMLAEAGRVYDLPIVTEVRAPEDVERMAEMSDVIQIGARNMQNFALLSEVGLTNRPVILKRGMSASIDEFLQAAEYILAGGNQRVILCERGIRTFETSSRNTLDVTAVPVLKRLSHLPVIVDPSHAAGDRDLVPPLAMAAAAAGAHGLMVEIHPDPDAALSDGPQSLDLAGFSELMTTLRRG